MKNNEQKMSYRSFGKSEYRRFCEIKFKFTTEVKHLLYSLLLTLLVVLPIILLLVQFFQTYIYNPAIRLLLIAIAWGLLLICNGLSNYFSVILAKHYYPENPNLTKIDEKAIFLFQTFNFGFMVFTLIVIIVIMMSSLL